MRLRAHFVRSAGVVVLAVATLLCTVGQTGPPYWLIYASDKGSGVVWIYKFYPGNDTVSYYTKITGLHKPEGLCENPQTHDVFVTEGGTSKIHGYHRGSTTPFITQDDPGYYPIACAIGRWNGNLVVANLRTEPAEHRGSVAMYPDGSGFVVTRRLIESPLFHRIYHIAFFPVGEDDNGYGAARYWFDGTKPNGSFILGWSAEAGTPVVVVTPSPLVAAMDAPSPHAPGGLQFIPGTGYLTISDRGTPVTKLFQVNPYTGAIANSITVSGTGGVNEFFVPLPAFAGIGRILAASSASGNHYSILTYPALTPLNVLPAPPVPGGPSPSGIVMVPGP